MWLKIEQKPGNQAIYVTFLSPDGLICHSATLYLKFLLRIPKIVTLANYAMVQILPNQENLSEFTICF